MYGTPNIITSENAEVPGAAPESKRSSPMTNVYSGINVMIHTGPVLDGTSVIRRVCIGSGCQGCDGHCCSCGEVGMNEVADSLTWAKAERGTGASPSRSSK